MDKYQYIINPLTNRRCRINSKLGRQIIKKYKKSMTGGADGEDVPHNVLGMLGEDRDIEGYIDEELYSTEDILNVEGSGIHNIYDLCINSYPIQGCREHFIKLYYISDNDDGYSLYVFIAEPDVENAQAMLRRRLDLIREGRDPAELQRTAGPLPRPIIWYFRGNNERYTGNNEICLRVVGSNRSESFFNPEIDERNGEITGENGGGWPESGWLLDTESVYREILAPELMTEPELQGIVFEEREEEEPFEEDEDDD